MRELCKISYWQTMLKSENMKDLFAKNTEQNVSIEIGLHFPKYGTQTMEADQPFKGILCLFPVFSKIFCNKVFRIKINFLIKSFHHYFTL